MEGGAEPRPEVLGGEAALWLLAAAAAAVEEEEEEACRLLSGERDLERERERERLRDDLDPLLLLERE